MSEWTNEVWTAIIAAFVIGVIVGFVILRSFKGNVQQQIKLESELKATRAQVEAQETQLEQHFAQSAQLLSTLADDYKKLYQHLAHSSETLLPEAEQAEFFKQPKLEAQPHSADSQPQDYSAGSSGLLKS